MPPNPSNLLNESTEALESTEDNGVTMPLVPNGVQQNPSTAKPISDFNMGVEGQDENAEVQGGAEKDDILSDEDHDMSDGGGAPLAMTSSHGETLNTELDTLDAEVMDADNLYGLHMDHYEGTMIEALPISYYSSHPSPYNFVQNSDVYDEDMMDEGELGPGPAALPNLPIAMSVVSQQLQHIQDEQGHANLTAIPEAQHGGVQDNMDDQINLSLAEFLYNWAQSTLREEDAKKRPRGPTIVAVESQRELKSTEPLMRSDLRGERCDIQRINWAEMGVSRLEARQMRRQTYKNYTNLRLSFQGHPRLNNAKLEDDQNYFRFRKMDFNHPVHLSHFQLRNLISCATRDHIFYAGRSTVHHYIPTRSAGSSGSTSVAMDLTNPTIQPLHAFPGSGVQISTLTVAEDILVAGGFAGEYGVLNLRAPKDTKHSEGIITQHQNGITNHVQVHQSRNSSSPVAAFASNDMSVRILDITTNKFITEHKFEYAINCTALSPDKRLRVLVGDNRNVMICNAETGEIFQDLEGHRDFGFACDWADDGWTVATGNQDMQVKIWDARKWTSCGRAYPVATIAADMAGVRKLKFSPIGSGKRVLVAAEPADFVNLICAETFTSKQTLSFFGEIGGVDFTNDGQDLIVANCDNMRGGIMEFERCNLAAEAGYGLEEYGDYVAEVRGGRDMTWRERAYDWKISDEGLASYPKSHGTQMQRTRRAAFLGTNMGFF